MALSNIRRFSAKKVLPFCGKNRRMFSAEVTDEVLFETKNNCGIITLNRPKNLNALNLSMVEKILGQLEAWEKSMSMVITKGVGRAFCAGGDIKGITRGGPQDCTLGKKFFRNEYTMDYKIGTYRIPYIALIDGITMGGGVGISVHGAYRVATEKTMFSMPETAIGLFPDVGASYFLTRLPGQLGLYLALTGHRLVGADCAKIGLATHYINSKNIEQLFNDLINTRGEKESIEAALNKYVENHSDQSFSLESKLTLIDRIFALPTVEDIFKELEREGSEWSHETLKTLKKMSPTSLKITKQELLIGKTLGLQECFQMENRLAGAAVEARISNDFYEGVRAMLVDKDRKPKWNPAKLEEITETMIQSCFAPLKIEEEIAL